MSGVVPRFGEVSMSCINTVRRCKTNQQSRIVENPNTYFSGSLNFYRNCAAIRGYVQDDEGTKLSEFRGAQVITACVCTIAETDDGVYGLRNDGKVCACIRPNTIVDANDNGPGGVVLPAERYYGFRLTTCPTYGGTFQICTNNNCKVWTNIEGGTPGAPFKDYIVALKDNTTGATAAQVARVTYNGGNCLYGCVQSVDGLWEIPTS